jgi:cyanophycinase
MLGGFPDYLEQTLSGSASWQAMLQAYQAGAVIGGSSAGAMVLCAQYYDPEGRAVQPGLGLVPRACGLPHHNTFGKGWASRLAVLVPEDILIGLDEQTGMMDDGVNGQWNVYGRGVVTLYRGGKTEIHRPGEPFSL